MKDLAKFEKDIQAILEKFSFDDETRREIFSLVIEATKADKPQKPKKGNQK